MSLWPRRAADGMRFQLDWFRTRTRHHNLNHIRQLCHTVPLAPDAVLCRALGRYKMIVDPADAGLSPHLMLDGVWEMWLTEALAAAIRPGMTVADVGANLGYFTLLMADLVGTAGRVHAAEPNPRMMNYLRRSVALNGFADRVSLHETPLSARAGDRVGLHVPVAAPQNGSIHRTGDAASVSYYLTTGTLDELIAEGPLDVVKIDAEGAEYDIWQGMQRLLARGTPLTVFLEFTPDRYPDPAAFLGQMAASGFSLAVIDPMAGVQPASVGQVLAGSSASDRMLVLRR